MNRSCAAASLILVAACTASPTTERIAARPSAIVGGTETDAYPATVALMASDHAFRGQVFCTGTLIARRAVLSAAHCMDPSFVMFGNNPELSGATFVPVSSFIRHDLYVEGDLAGIEHDVAIAILSEDAPNDVSPVRVLPAPTSLGVDVTWVGFGHTGYEADDKGLKRTVTHPVTGSLGNLLATANASCRADSGGSVYELVGSELALAGSDRGSASMCTGDSYFVPTSINLDWISATIDANGGRGTGDVDAGMPVDDASMPTRDAGATVADSSVADPDMGSTALTDSGIDPTIRERSSGCNAAATSSRPLSPFACLTAMFALAVATFRGRTRIRR